MARFEALSPQAEQLLQAMLGSVAKQLLAAIEDSGMTRADLARTLGVSTPYVTQFLRGQK